MGTAGEGHQAVADDGSQQRRYLQIPGVLTAVGSIATLVVTAAVVVVLLRFGGGAKAVSENAAIIAALVALGGIFTTQMVNSALEDRRAQTAHNIEVERAQEAAVQ